MKTLCILGGPVVAWTGGTAPDKTKLTPARCLDFEALTRCLFREQCREWVGFWFVPLPLAVARVFWGRARHDAWATCRSVGWAE